jgi:hypothetical protein
MIKLKADKSYERKVELKTPKTKEKPEFKIKKQYNEVDVDSVLPFGKYKGEIFSDVIKKDKNYLQWCLENVTGLKLTENAKNLVVTK